MSAVIEKYSTLLPRNGQGKRIVKAKLLTALGATGVLLPFPQNPEHIIERKILLQNTFGSTVAPPPSPTNTFTLDWVRRVIFNGGAMPSQNTINNLLTFELNLRNNNLINKIIHCNFMAPDSLIACLTPFIVGVGGFDPYAEQTFGYTGAVTINGWQFMNTGDPVLISMFTPSAGGIATFLNCGIVMYGYTINDANNYQDWGAYKSATNDGLYFENMSGNHFTQVGQVLITVAGVAPNGYYSCQRTNATTFNMYFANSGTPHASVGSNATPETGNVANLNFSMGVGLSTNGTPFVLPQNRCYSFFAVTLGLSATDSGNLFTAVQAFRQGLGGGFR